MPVAITHLSIPQLRRFRRRLLAKRRELVGDLTAIENDELDSDDGDLSHVPIHIADVGTDTFQEDLLRRLAENDRALLSEIDAALIRIGNGTFGICEATGATIPETRLEAMPWARCTVEAELTLDQVRTVAADLPSPVWAARRRRVGQKPGG